jgi:enoyl-CoA hydratase/carnithine racemase
MPDHSQFNIDRTYPGLWTITFSNPPINMFVPTTIVELGALMTDLEADRSVKVVVFQSANPDFFIAHLDVAKAAERPEVLGFWRDLVLRLSSTPVVSIAKIRGRTAASVTSLCWPATCASPVGKAPYSATPRSALD